MIAQTSAPARIPPAIPTSIVCKTCKEETGLTKETLMETTIDTHICCPICNAMIYSCLPSLPPPYVYGGSSHVYGDYD